MSYLPESPETVRAVLEAEDIANRSHQPISSAHLLLALFTFPNRAQVLLRERNVDEDRILSEIRLVEDEPPRTLARLRDRAKEIAAGAGATDVDSLHLLIALTRLRDAFAYRLLQRTGTSLTALRNVAVSYVTGNLPRRYRALPKPEPLPQPVLPQRTRVAAASVLEPSAKSAPKAQRAPTVSERRPPKLEPPPPDDDLDDYDDEDEDQVDVDVDGDEFDAVSEAVEAAGESPTRPTARSEAVADRPPRPTTGRPWHQAPPQPQAQAVRPLAELAPTLSTCGVDLTEMARKGDLDLAIGRDSELERLIDILGKRRANNPVLVGPPGVGKTAIVEGLAVKIARGDDDVQGFHDRTIFALDTGALVAGTSLRGAFSERLGAIKAEVAAAKGAIVVFIDELHTLVGAGTSGEGPQDAANELKAALARGEFPCIGATTEDEFKKHIEKDPALERRFDPIFVAEPSVDETILILEGAITPYAEHHQVQYTLDAVHAAVRLSHRFVPERKLPDKAFAVIDLAGSRARRRGATEVNRIDIAHIIHEWSAVPLDRLAEADADRFARAEDLMGEKLVGHREVLAAVCRAIRRGFAGFNGRRPIGSFLFLGPTGVGKTELVKVMAEFLFGRRECVVRVDMSEYSEKHSVARLIGAQPGYIGYEEGGQLTEALRKRPFQIVLFDEIEKAHREVLHLLLQVLDEGHLTDARGRRVSFANTLVVLTSNLGTQHTGGQSRGIGFGGQSGEPTVDSAPVLEAARAELPPELWGRLDERLVFAPLSRAQVRQVATLQLEESSRTLFDEREITLSWNDRVLEHLLDHGGYNEKTGARGMRQAIQRFVEGPIAEMILKGELNAGDRAQISLGDGPGLVISVKSQSSARHHAG